VQVSGFFFSYTAPFIQPVDVVETHSIDWLNIETTESQTTVFLATLEMGPLDLARIDLTEQVHRFLVDHNAEERSRHAGMTKPLLEPSLAFVGHMHVCGLYFGFRRDILFLARKARQYLSLADQCSVSHAETDPFH
jgi:hypothetical protein